MGVLSDQLSAKTSVFGLRLWVIIGIMVGVFMVAMLVLLSVWLISKRKSRKADESFPLQSIPSVSKEIQEVEVNRRINMKFGSHNEPLTPPEDKVVVHIHNHSNTSARNQPQNGELQEKGQVKSPAALKKEIEDSIMRFDSLKKTLLSGTETPDEISFNSGSIGSPVRIEVAQYGFGQFYSLRELSIATQGFADSNVIGEGGYGIVYRGKLPDGTFVAIKNLLNNKGQAEHEFKVEVETIGRVRHKNLVRMLGYCVEGSYRMLVYEFMDNGNLEQWLHGPISRTNTPTWKMRMKIMLGTAKGLSYLHESLEPKVVHRDIKASNILLDFQWNAKVSDFGLAKLLVAEKSHITTRVMGTFGYVAPEYANTGLLNERSDIYSFGVLMLETITGRDPVDYSRPNGEVNLVDWLKTMVANKRSENVCDPRLEERPSLKELKRALLIALRCVDPDASKRPRMGYVVHMLEAEQFPFRDEQKRTKDSNNSQVVQAQSQQKMMEHLTKEVKQLEQSNSRKYSPVRFIPQKWKIYEG